MTFCHLRSIDSGGGRRRVDGTTSLDASSSKVRQMDFLDGFDFLFNAVIHSYSLPFVSEIVQRATLLISGFSQALGASMAWI
jgi:hypothetical protein